MGDLTSITNDRGQSVITLLLPDGSKHHILGIGTKDVSHDDDASWMGVATHQNGAVVNGTDGLVVIGGSNPDNSDLAEPALVIDGRLQTGSAPSSGALTDRSDTITAGGTEQVLAAANPNRRYLLVINDANETEDLWIEFTDPAVESSPSVRIIPGGSFVMEAGFVSNEEISVIAATTGHAFTAKEG